MVDKNGNFSNTATPKVTARVARVAQGGSQHEFDIESGMSSPSPTIVDQGPLDPLPYDELPNLNNGNGSSNGNGNGGSNGNGNGGDTDKDPLGWLQMERQAWLLIGLVVAAIIGFIVWKSNG